MTDDHKMRGKISSPEMYAASSGYVGEKWKKHAPSTRQVYSYQQYSNLCYVNNNDKPMTFKIYLDNIYC